MRTSEGSVAVTGATGRLGRAIVAVTAPDVVAWGRPDYDLDRPETAGALLSRDRPRLVIHTAAMTDVDGCARDPDTAMRRNADAVDALAKSCASMGAKLVLISTNEVFDGERPDGHGYVEDDPPRPQNPYGASKLAGEQAAQTVFGGSPGLWIVRTSWLYGPPGRDFPDKILTAADRLPNGEALPVAADEHGSPTLTKDLAEAIVALVDRTEGGLFHLVNDGWVSRFGWAERILAACRSGRRVRAIPGAAYKRASDPPPWGVLDGSRAALVADIHLRHWQLALDEELSQRCASGSPLP